MIRGRALEVLLSQRTQKVLKEVGYYEDYKEVEINDFEGENFSNSRVEREN